MAEQDTFWLLKLRTYQVPQAAYSLGKPIWEPFGL